MLLASRDDSLYCLRDELGFIGILFFLWFWVIDKFDIFFYCQAKTFTLIKQVEVTHSEQSKPEWMRSLWKSKSKLSLIRALCCGGERKKFGENLSRTKESNSTLKNLFRARLASREMLWNVCRKRRAHTQILFEFLSPPSILNSHYKTHRNFHFGSFIGEKVFIVTIFPFSLPLWKQLKTSHKDHHLGTMKSCVRGFRYCWGEEEENFISDFTTPSLEGFEYVIIIQEMLKACCLLQ